MHGRTALRGVVAVCLAGLLAWSPTADAQQLGVTLDASSTPALELSLSEVARAGGSVGAEARLGADPGAALSFRWSEILAGIGNVVVEGNATARFGADPAVRGMLGARGVLGPVAARVHVDAFSAPPERFASAGRSADAPFAAGTSLRVAGDGRLDRTWLMAVSARSWHAEQAWIVDVDASMRARALLGRNWDGRASLETRWGTDVSHQSLGVGFVWAPRRAPEISASAWIDRAIRGDAVTSLPGAEFEGAWRVGGDRLEARVVARPAGRARAAWSLETVWRHPWSVGTLVLQGGARAGGVSGDAWDVRIRYELPVDLSVGPRSADANR